MDNFETLACPICKSLVAEEAFFCHHCGNQLKCKHCQERLVVEAQNCSACGAAVINYSAKNTNVFKLRESKEERVYEIEFTNEVGHEIKSVIADLLKGKTTHSYLPEEKLTIETPLALKATAIKTEELTSGESQIVSNNEVVPVPGNLPEEPEDYPHLNDLEIKLNCKENEWLLLFAFYNSNYGKSTFSKDLVWQLYKDKRKTPTRFKNMGTNWKSLFKRFISTVKENEFRFTTAGLQKIDSLLRPNRPNSKTSANQNLRRGSVIPGARATTIRTMPVSRKVLANSIVPNEFDIYKTDYKESLEAFFQRKKPGNGNPNRIVTIAYYITNMNHQEYFTEGNIDFAYRVLGLSGKPAHLKQVIINLKNERVWFQKVIDKSVTGWKLTRQAEIYVDEKLPPRT